MALQPDGQLLATGELTKPGESRPEGLRLVRIRGDGSVDEKFQEAVVKIEIPTRIGRARIWCIKPAPDGKIWIGGNFGSVRGVARNDIACLNPDGSLNRSFNPQPGVQGGGEAPISEVALQADGKVVVCGEFWRVNGVARNNLVRLNADGSVDTSFHLGLKPEETIESIAALPDGKLLVGGKFTEIRGRPRRHIARINPDGTLDDTFAPAKGVKNGQFFVQPDGKILVHGWFDDGQGVGRNRPYRLNADGSLDAAFNVGAGPDGSINTVATQPDGKIIIGGWFKNVGGISRPYIARLNADGSLDRSFDPGSGPDTAVSAVALQPDGKVVIAGDFTNLNGTACQRIARLNPDGTLDRTFKLDGGVDAWVHCLALQPDGRILLGGRFKKVGGVQRAFSPVKPRWNT